MSAYPSKRSPRLMPPHFSVAWSARGSAAPREAFPPKEQMDQKYDGHVCFSFAVLFGFFKPK